MANRCFSTPPFFYFFFLDLRFVCKIGIFNTSFLALLLSLAHLAVGQQHMEYGGGRRAGYAPCWRGDSTCGQRTKPQAFTLKNNGPHSRVRSTRITRRRPTPGRNANSKFRPPGHPPPCASLLSLPSRRRPGARCGVAPTPRRRILPP